MTKSSILRGAIGKAAAGKMFKTEVELCAAFAAVLPPEWTAYNECSGHDILLVCKADGRQIGVQAKLKLNAEVVAQAIEGEEWYRVAGPNPDYRAVLVPDSTAASFFDKICDCLGLTVVRVRSARPEGYFRGPPSFSPPLPTDPKYPYVCRHWHDTATVERHKLPEYVPDVAAGASSPLQLTEWKVKALKIAVTLEMRGHLTRRDFAHHQIDHRRWVAQRWIQVADGEGRYLRGDNFPDFERQHPVVFAKVRADAPRWLPKTVLDAEKPEAML
jgi:hypothetical protein